MAIIKHIANKSSNYSAALTYLIFKHDEFTQKPLLDDQGNYQLRDEYYIEGLNCEPFSFETECEETNASFCKNYSDREIKSHHYIISFDPKDSVDSGLTGETAQRLGREFARKYFAGHQALICTHTDGHNESGNIHVHIVLNSLRKLDIEETDFTERPCDSRAGFKHHVTDKLLNHMKQYVMDMCEREHLHQVDLLSPAQDNVTEREYWKGKREQDKLDLSSDDASADAASPQTVFQTQKQFLREAINEVSLYAGSEDEFSAELDKHYSIKTKISRGRYSYLHPERSKYITGRSLGANYTEDYLRPLFEGNKKIGRTRNHVLRHSEFRKTIRKSQDALPMRMKNQPDYDPSYDYMKDPRAALHFYTRLRLVVNLQTCAKAQQSRAYARKVKLSNLQEMAKTICFAQEHGYDTRADVTFEMDRTVLAMTKIKENMQHTDSRIQDLNEQIHYTGQLYVNRNIILSGKRDAIRNHGSLRQFNKDHQKEQDLWNEARRYFRERSLSVPQLQDLKEERDRLLKLKQAQQKAYNNFKEFSRELDTAAANIDSILAAGREATRTTEKAQDR